MKNTYNIGDCVKYNDLDNIFYGKIVDIYISKLGNNSTLVVIPLFFEKNKLKLTKIQISANSKYLSLEKDKQLKLELLYKIYLLKES